MTNFKKNLLSAALLSTMIYNNSIAMDDSSKDSVFGDGVKRSFLINQEDTTIGGDTRTITFHGGISTDYGVSSKFARVFPEHRVGPKSDGSYMYEKGEISDDARRGLSLFAAATRIGQMYDGDIHSIAKFRKTAEMTAVATAWDNPGMTPIYIQPNDTSGTNNAYFMLHKRHGDYDIPVAHFYNLKKNGKIVGNVGDSIDASGHEFGHFYKTRMNRNSYRDYKIQGSAAHEYFGDMTSLFLVMDDKNNCMKILRAAKGDLRNVPSVVHFGEKTGDAIFSNPLRNYDKDDTIRNFRSSRGHYNLSQIMTGTVFDILADGYKEIYDNGPSQYRCDPEMLLYDLGRTVRSMVY